MKKQIMIMITILSCVVFVTSSAFAGSKQRHRWEGVAIGVGASILGAAIINDAHRSHDNVVTERVITVPDYEPRHRPPHHSREYHHYYHPSRDYDDYRHSSRHDSHRNQNGYWDVRNVWVPPVCEKVWNPAHFENSVWVQGHWISIEKYPGYWKEEKVWICER
ncbi:MAG: hypothetical protein HQK77_01860 [Desulfobacterales bacterium]|nr:hypothetical protein [Desulfobacterales bacterium]